jgi:hypothetical protein
MESAGNILKLGENPYWVFVSFLYGWVISDIARRFAEASSNWWERRKQTLSWEFAPVYSHLTLAAFVVGTSWLGWTSAFLNSDSVLSSAGLLTLVIGPISPLLIIDFWILATYFVFTAQVNEARLSHKRERPLAGHSAFWVWLILIAYFFWDFLVYFVIPLWTGKYEGGLWSHTWMSLFCALVVFIGFWPMRKRQSCLHFDLWTDVSLIFLVLFYRCLRQLICPRSVVQMISQPAPCVARTLHQQILALLCPCKEDWLAWLAWVAFALFAVTVGVAYRYGWPHESVDISYGGAIPSPS